MGFGIRLPRWARTGAAQDASKLSCDSWEFVPECASPGYYNSATDATVAAGVQPHRLEHLGAHEALTARQNIQSRKAALAPAVQSRDQKVRYSTNAASKDVPSFKQQASQAVGFFTRFATNNASTQKFRQTLHEAAPAPFVSCWGNSQTCPFAAQQTAPTQSGRIATTTAALSSAPNDKPEAAVGKAARNDAMPLQKEDCMWNMARWQQPLRDALTAAAVPLHSALAAVAVPCWPQPGLPRSGSGQPSAASDDASPPGGSCREVAAAAAAACAEQTDAESVAAMAASTEHEPWLLLRADSLWQPVFEEVDTMSMCGEDEALFQYLDNIMDENSSEFADCESDTSADEWIERADDIVACAVGVAPRDQRCAQLASTGSSGYWTAASDHAPDQAGPASWRGASAARGDRCRGAAENLGCRQRASARRSQEDMQEMLQRRTALWLQSYV